MKIFRSWMLASHLLTIAAPLVLTNCKDAYDVRDANAGFAVAFPGTAAPKDRTRTQDGVELHALGVDDPSGSFYRVTWSDLPQAAAGSPKDVYDAKRIDLTRGHGAIERESDVHTGNVLGREFVYRASDDRSEIRGTMRLFVNGERLYQVHFFATPNALDATTVERGKHFLDSFQLLKP